MALSAAVAPLAMGLLAGRLPQLDDFTGVQGSTWGVALLTLLSSMLFGRHIVLWRVAQP